MARFEVEFNADNAAFDDGNEGRDEVREILEKLAELVKGSDRTDGAICDSNGNTIGRWFYERDDDD